jgi:hypothetical protein
MRKNNRKSFNYKSGYVALSVPVPPNKYQDPNKPTEHMALFPADKFVESFGENQFLRTILSNRAKNLIEDWQETNSGPDCAGQKTNVERLFTLMDHRWTNWRRGEDHSLYELQLNSYKSASN